MTNITASTKVTAVIATFNNSLCYAYTKNSAAINELNNDLKEGYDIFSERDTIKNLSSKYGISIDELIRGTK